MGGWEGWGGLVSQGEFKEGKKWWSVLQYRGVFSSWDSIPLVWCFSHPGGGVGWKEQKLEKKGLY